MSKLNYYLEMSKAVQTISRGGALMDVGAGGMQSIIDAIKLLHDKGMSARDIAAALLELLDVTDEKWIDILEIELKAVTEAMDDPKKLKKLMSFFNDSYMLISKYKSGNVPKREEVVALMDKYPEFDVHFKNSISRENYIRLFTTRQDITDYASKNRDKYKEKEPAQIEAPREDLKMSKIKKEKKEKVKVPR